MGLTNENKTLRNSIKLNRSITPEDGLQALNSKKNVKTHAHISPRIMPRDTIAKVQSLSVNSGTASKVHLSHLERVSNEDSETEPMVDILPS